MTAPAYYLRVPVHAVLMVNPDEWRRLDPSRFTGHDPATASLRDIMDEARSLFGATGGVPGWASGAVEVVAERVGRR